MQPVARRIPRRAPLTVFIPRAAGTWSSTQRTVLVPKSQARVQCGASVRSTSQSGITMVSRIQCVPTIPLSTDAATKPRFFIAFGLVCAGSSAEGAAAGAAVDAGSGRRETRTALPASISAVTTGSSRMTVWLSVASASPLMSAPRVNPRFSADRR